MIDVCKYRYIFGKEKEGVHRYRIFNIAIVDLLGTILGAWILAKWLQQSFWLIFVIVFLLGIILHRLFCVPTTITKFLFGNF
jgi:fatty acid desaturase